MAPRSPEEDREHPEQQREDDQRADPERQREDAGAEELEHQRADPEHQREWPEELEHQHEDPERQRAGAEVDQRCRVLVTTSALRHKPAETCAVFPA